MTQPPAKQGQTPDNRELYRLLAPIRQRFYDGLFDRILRLEAAAQMLKADPHCAEALDVVQRDCHKLAGVAPTLGFTEAGRLALEIEVSLKSGHGFGEATAQGLERLLDELEAHLDAAA